MSEIPDDIGLDAEKWADQLYEGVSIDVPPERASLIIARAILAERQRCADVARRYLDDIAGCDMSDDEPDKIAAAIMDLKWQPPPL